MIIGWISELLISFNLGKKRKHYLTRRWEKKHRCCLHLKRKDTVHLETGYGSPLKSNYLISCHWLISDRCDSMITKKQCQGQLRPSSFLLTMEKSFLCIKKIIKNPGSQGGVGVTRMTENAWCLTLFSCLNVWWKEESKCQLFTAQYKFEQVSLTGKYKKKTHSTIIVWCLLPNVIKWRATFSAKLKAVSFFFF